MLLDGARRVTSRREVDYDRRMTKKRRPVIGVSLSRRFEAKRRRSALPFPLVACDTHESEPGYVVCRHVIDGAAVDEVIAATDADLGQVLCEKDHSEASVDDAVVVCASCARERGFLKKLTN